MVKTGGVFNLIHSLLLTDTYNSLAYGNSVMQSTLTRMWVKMVTVRRVYHYGV